MVKIDAAKAEMSWHLVSNISQAYTSPDATISIFSLVNINVQTPLTDLLKFVGTKSNLRWHGRRYQNCLHRHYTADFTGWEIIHITNKAILKKHHVTIGGGTILSLVRFSTIRAFSSVALQTLDFRFIHCTKLFSSLILGKLRLLLN